MTAKVLLVFLGGGLGSVLRLAAGIHWNRQYPYGTLAVNLIGCLAIGAAAEAFTRLSMLDSSARLFLVTGILGGFTTYSSFSQETFLMLEKAPAYGIAYAGITLVVGLLCNLLGFLAARSILAAMGK